MKRLCSQTKSLLTAACAIYQFLVYKFLSVENQNKKKLCMRIIYLSQKKLNFELSSLILFKVKQQKKRMEGKTKITLGSFFHGHLCMQRQSTVVARAARSFTSRGINEVQKEESKTKENKEKAMIITVWLLLMHRINSENSKERRSSPTCP